MAMSSGSISGYCQNPSPVVSPTIYVDELTINWDYYQGYTLDIEGTLECLTNMYCDFVPSPGLPSVVWVDIRMLSLGEKRGLIEYCRASCAMIVRGRVDLTNISAQEIWKKREEQ
jgi:hypothetical protein